MLLEKTIGLNFIGGITSMFKKLCIKGVYMLKNFCLKGSNLNIRF